MSLFGDRKEPAASPEPTDPLPVETFDQSKRYNIYCSNPGEDRVYENVKIVGIRTFQKPKNDFGSALIGGYIEIEAEWGAHDDTISRHIFNLRARFETSI